MMIFVSIKQLVRTFWWLIVAIAAYLLFKTIGLSMTFLLVIGLLSLYFAPVLFVPIVLIALGVHFTGGFSFIPDLLTSAFWLIVMGFILVIISDSHSRRAVKKAEEEAIRQRQLAKKAAKK